jgi:hypothetical protein
MAHFTVVDKERAYVEYKKRTHTKFGQAFLARFAKVADVEKERAYDVACWVRHLLGSRMDLKMCLRLRSVQRAARHDDWQARIKSILGRREKLKNKRSAARIVDCVLVEGSGTVVLVGCGKGAGIATVVQEKKKRNSD